MKDADVIIVGSGAGGLTSAVALANGGKRVLVFEQHYVPGGWCHSFYLDGQRFSPGVHYIGELGVGQPSRRILEGLGVANDLSFFQMNVKGYDHCVVGDRRVDFPAHPDVLLENLREDFPKEKVQIRYYHRLLRQVYEELGFALQLEAFKDYVRMPFVTRHLGRTALFSLQNILNRYLSDPVLKTVLGMQSGNYAMQPSRARFVLHAAVAGHYFNGGFYPVGGGGAIAKAFTNGIRRHGGSIQTRAKVSRILIEGGKAIGVRLEDGSEYRADCVISNADPHSTYFNMVDPEHVPSKYRKKVERLKYSLAALNTFLILDTDLRSLGMDSGNVWYAEYPDLNKIYDHLRKSDPFSGKTFPALFMGSPTLKDPSSCDGRYHTLEAITFLPYHHFQEFEGTRSGQRSQNYASAKELVAAKVMRTVEKILPGISEHVVRCEVGTPLTANHYIASTMGNSYGTEKTFGQLGPMGFNMHSPIGNLYHAGASTLSHGVLGACNSGLMVAGKILDAGPTELLAYGKDQYLRVFPAEDPRSWPDWIVEKQRTRERRAALKATLEAQ